jgi:hypothetical protein
MPLVEKDTINNSFHCWSIGRIIKNDVAALPPNSSVAFLGVPAIALCIILPTSVDPVRLFYLYQG